MASVHPCKHASVMKKVIERMGAAAGAEQRRALSTDEPASSGSTAAGGKKRRWLGLRKSSAAGTKGATEEANDKEKELEEDGLQVDFYLVIVRSPLFQLNLPSSALLTCRLNDSLQFLKFIAS